MHKDLLIFIILLAISVTLIFSATISTLVLAYGNANDTVTMDVNVSATSKITLLPKYINWTLVGSGTAGVPRNITLKNTGSLNVTHIYAYVDTLTYESTRPYGSSNSSKYSAGGVLTIRNESDLQFYYLGRIEWNWTEDIPTHSWANVNSPVAWGYFRNTTDDYVWVIGNGTGGLCNNTFAQFAIEDDKDTGLIEARTPTTDNISRIGGDSNWSFFNVIRPNTPFNNSCVAVYSDCSKIYIYNFDKRDTDPNTFSTCTNSDYIHEGNLTPGDTVIMQVNPWIPYGTPSGNLTTTTLTLIAT
jgi:hypothetical protein